MTSGAYEAAIEALSASALFSDFSTSSLHALSEYFSTVQGTTGDRLYEQGDPSAGLYLVVSGTLRTLVRGPDGIERQVGELGPSDSFGELSLLLRGSRFVTVEASSPVVALELSLEAFRALKLHDPDLCLMLIMTIVRRFGRVLDNSRDVLQGALLRHLADADAK